MFNLFFVTDPNSYWAVIIPMCFAIDMINDAFTRHAQEHVAKLLEYHATVHKFDKSKRYGTLRDDMCMDFLTELNSGER